MSGGRRMKRILAAAVFVVAIGAVAYVVLNRTDGAAGAAPALAGAPASAALLTRGEYLTKAADCVACHSVAESGKPFAGGVAFKLPFGTIYSSNITADPDTGIGTWSDDDFVHAVREGVGKDGTIFSFPSISAGPWDSGTRPSSRANASPPIRRSRLCGTAALTWQPRWATAASAIRRAT
jgi:hypothetical protein